MFSFLFGSSKYDYVTVGEYRYFSTKEKLKYHKSRGKDASQLSYSLPFSKAVKEMYHLLLRDKNQESGFYLSPLTVSLNKIGRAENSSMEPEIRWNRPCGETVKIQIATHQGLISVSVSIGGKVVAFMIGEDNVMEWMSPKYKSVLKIIVDTLYEEIETQY